MKIFNIYPHNAYLNTEICIFSEFSHEIEIVNTTNGNVIKLSKGMQWRSKLQYGINVFRCKYKDFEQVEEVYVENAIKLGGSTIKMVYVFDLIPWILVVMKDRTYFYNRDNDREFVEHRFSPEKVEVISNNHLLMTSKGEMSIFSLDLSMPIMSFTEKLYLDDKHVVIEESDVENNESYKLLSVYYYQKNLPYNDNKLSFSCQDYSVDSENKMIYTYENGKIDSLSIEKSIKTEILNSTNTFRCFINCHYVVLEEVVRNIKQLKVVNLIDNREFIILSGYRYPLISINSQQIVDKKQYEDTFDNLTAILKQGYDSIELSKTYLSISFFWIGGFIYYELRTTKQFTTETGKLKGELSIIIGCSQTNYQREIPTNTFFECLEVDDKFIIKCQQEAIVLQDGNEVIILKEGQLLKTPQSYVFLRKKENKDYIYNLNNVLLHIGNFNLEYLEKYGVIISKNVKNQSIFRLIGESSYYTCEEPKIHEFNDSLLVYNLTSEYPTIHINGKVLSCKSHLVKWISKKCRYYIYNHNDKLFLSTWNEELKGFNETEILTSIFESTNFSDAYFANGGSSIVYKQYGKDTYDYFDITKQEKVEFSTGKFIQNINGYRPIIEFDEYRKPVIIDPVTMKVASSTYLSQYFFASPDGRYRVEEKRIIEYLHKSFNKNITEEDYSKLKNQYDFSVGMSQKNKEEIIKKRVFFIRTNKISDIKIDSLIVKSDLCFVDNVIIQKIEYLNVFDHESKSTFKVKLGDPLWFLNYVSFSYDNKYMAIAGKYPEKSGGGGLFLLYDLQKMDIAFKINNTNAVWITAFNKLGQVCFYTSTPNTYLGFADDLNPQLENFDPQFKKRNFLCFSPSGKFVVLSNQGYITKNSSAARFVQWGHQPSSDIDIYSTDSSKEEFHFNDHGDGINGVALKVNSVAFAAMSNDDKRLLSVSKDGVIVVRNLDIV